MGHQPALEDRSVSIAEHPARQPWQQGDIGMTPASDPKTSKLKETIEASSPPPSTETMRKTNSTCQHSYKHQAHVVSGCQCWGICTVRPELAKSKGRALNEAKQATASPRCGPMAQTGSPPRCHPRNSILCVYIYNV